MVVLYLNNSHKNDFYANLIYSMLYPYQIFTFGFKNGVFYESTFYTFVNCGEEGLKLVAVSKPMTLVPNFVF